MSTMFPDQRPDTAGRDREPGLRELPLTGSMTAGANGAVRRDQAASILLVDDEPTILEALRFNLTREGYEVLTAGDGRTALALARGRRPDLIVLDLMLPDLDGLEVCRLLRQEKMATPILMLTAKDSETDKVVGLELGADDYMTKPCGLRELFARIKALLRRAEMRGDPPPDREARFGDVCVLLDQHRVFNGDCEVSLSPKEYDVLTLLLANRGHVLTREILLEKIWGYAYVGDTRTVDVHVHWLREKLEPEPARPRYIKTVRGVGYRFEGD
jgi:two-component system alkaline phosphatase synthesis response regulator PhoP